MSRHRFHHLVLELRSSPPGDPLALLLAHLPPAFMEAPVDLRLETRAASGAELEPHLKGEPAVRLGDVALRLGAGALELAGPGARFTVDALPLPRVTGLVDPAALAAPPAGQALARGLALLALAAALRARGVFHLEAAALVLPGERAVLVPGRHGVGKRTLAAALVAVGAERLDDEAIFLVRRDGELRLLALARGPGRTEGPAPAVLLLPHRTDQATSRLEPAGPAEALGVLLEASPLLGARGLPGGDGHLPLLGALAEGARVLHAELGLDLLSDGAAVARRLVSELADA